MTYAPSPPSVERELENTRYRGRGWKFEAGSERRYIANSAVAGMTKMSRNDFGRSKDTSAGQSSALLHADDDAIGHLARSLTSVAINSKGPETTFFGRDGHLVDTSGRLT